ncbi:MAG TPA: HAMP domain-containing sensor histidine kinase, partial [Acidimicrobiia bacterium]|nr:HAMP domain-containing sensor histidine kinase [Acidimicrobiia bacterium]
EAVFAGHPSRQAYRLAGTSRLAVGLQLPDVDASYFEVFSLDQLDRTLRFLGLALLGAGLATTIAGAAVGRWASTRLLRPVAEVAQAAAAVAGGRLETRLPDSDDADLATLTSSFNSMADALQARIERDTRFASDVSHELRSPLTTLATTVGVLAARRDELPERARAALDLLTADVDRFQRLVEDLLEISRYDAGVADLHLEDVRLTELVMRAVASVNGPPVELGPGAVIDGLAVQVDTRRMTQVIKNLVENAARYGGGATRVIVDAGHYVARVAVDDEGPGVAAEEREAIFERFFRGSASGQRRGGGQGSGLGLSLVSEHVRLHGGRVWVEDNPIGRGARFVLEIPLVRPEDEA